MKNISNVMVIIALVAAQGAQAVSGNEHVLARWTNVSTIRNGIMGACGIREHYC